MRHRSLENTERYIHIAEVILGAMLSDEWTTKVAATIEEACKLIEVGFEKADEIGGLHIYRKRR